MYYVNRVELQEFYSMFKNDEELFKNLKSEQLDVCREYFKQITKYKAETIEGKSLVINGTEYMYAICNLTSKVECESLDGQVELCYIAYVIRDLSTDKERVVTGEVVDKLMSGRNMMIKSLAENTLSELKYVTYISITDNVVEYVKDNYKRIAFVLEDKTVVDKYKNLYQEFYNVYLPLPSYLIDRFNKKLDIQYQTNVFDRQLTSLTKDIKTLKSSEHALTDFGKTVIVNTGNEDERLNYARLVVRYHNAYLKVSNHGKIDMMLFIKAGMQKVYYVHAPNGDRLATKKEKNLLVSACFKKNVYFIPEEKLNLIKVFVWAHTGKFELLTSAGYDISKYANNNVVTSSSYEILFNDEFLEALITSIKYMESDEFLHNDVKDLAKGLKAIEYLESAEDEIQDLGLKVKLETIRKECARTSNDFLKMAYDIAYKALKYNNLVLSVKQMNVVNKAYETLVSEKNNPNNKFSSELVEMINTIVDYNRYKKGTFMYKLINSIMENKRCSLKQYGIIEAEYDKIKSIVNCEVDEIGEDIDYYSAIKNKDKNNGYSIDSIFINEESYIDDNSWSADNWEMPKV